MGLENANTTENDTATQHPVIALITDWTTAAGDLETRSATSDLGGTMRMGEQECVLTEDSLTFKIYGERTISERHRHRYEVNESYVGQLESAGLRIAGRSEKDDLVEVIEVIDHPWFVACQFHPEFTSSPRRGHPMFIDFVRAGLTRHNLTAASRKAN